MTKLTFIWRISLLAGFICAGGCNGETVAAGADAGIDVGATLDLEDSTDNEVLDALEDVTALDEPHPIGMEVPPFELEDLNPTSATYGQMINSADLAGAPYGLVFLDSRCRACSDVADGLWAEYVKHETWWASQPTFAVERASAMVDSPESVELVVDGNSMPYLADTEEVDLWMAFRALNHDYFAISADGELDVWLELYTWPDDLPLFIDHMTERYGD